MILKYYLSIFLEGLKKITKRLGVASVLTSFISLNECNSFTSGFLCRQNSRLVSGFTHF
jgi:hypothetical protein